MSGNVADYLAKVPPLNWDKPKFLSELTAILQPFCDAQGLLNDLPSYFDLDTAIGAQLDVDGQWIGRSRTIPIPLQPCFFSLGDPIRGLGKGVWRHAYNPGVTFTYLDDASYRRLLKAKALANEWDGSVEGGQAALDQFIVPGSGTLSFIDDGGWGVQSGDAVQMTVTIGISGHIPSIVDLEILAQNLIGIKPAAVNLIVAVTSVEGAPIFGLGVDNGYVGGLGHGSIAVPPSFIAYADSDLLEA